MARLFLPLLLLLAGCSDGPSSDAQREPAKPPELVTGQTAFYKMYMSARSWAADVQPLRLTQIDVDEMKAEGGKAPAWEALFVSQSLRQVRRYAFSVIHKPVRNLRAGVIYDPPDSWSPGGELEPFLALAFKTDSPAAYEVAMKHGRDYARKNPALPVRFLLEKTHRFPDPAWRVYWGESVSTSSYSVFVDAMTGNYLATGR